MYSGYASGEILPALSPNHKPSLDNHVPKLLLARESLDALDQILIAIAITRDQLPNQRDRAKTPPLVNGVEKGPVAIDFAEFEDSQHAAGLQDAVRLPEGSGDVTKVSNAKRHRVQVDRVVGDAGALQVLGVGLEKGQGGLLAGGQRQGALFADGEHGWVDVGDGDADVGVGVQDVRGVQVAEGNVACAACYVEDVLGRRVGMVRGGGMEAWVEGGDVVISVLGREGRRV